MSYHNPVLLAESVKQLVTNPSGLYIDVTFGGGGHSRKILENLDSEGRLLAFDQDPDASNNAALLSKPTICSVTKPQPACSTAPKDQMMIAQR